MKFENLKLWLSLPVVFFQYRREVNRRYYQEGSYGRCRYCVAAAFAVALVLGFQLFHGGLPLAVASQFSAFVADASKSVPAIDKLVDDTP